MISAHHTSVWKFKCINPVSNNNKTTKKPSVAAHLRGRGKQISVGSRPTWFTQWVEVSQGCAMRSYPHPQQQTFLESDQHPITPVKSVPQFLSLNKVGLYQGLRGSLRSHLYQLKPFLPGPHLHTTAVISSFLDVLKGSLHLLTPLPKKCCHRDFPPPI